MLATWVPARLTPFSFEDAAVAMRAALRHQLQAEPSRETLALALAKCALETGRWKSIWANNWGNVKAGVKYEGLYCCFELNEVLREKGPDGKPRDVVVWFSPRGRLDRKGGKVVAEPFEDPPGHPQTRMRAYLTREDGAIAYVSFVSGGRYADGWQLLLKGDAVGYVRAIKAKGYFTADEAKYRAGVVSMQREFIGKLSGLSLDPALTDDDMCAALACVAPDPERFLHTEAVLAASSSMDGVWDAIRAERNAAMREDDDSGTPNA
jgi:hypothetical protein